MSLASASHRRRHSSIDNINRHEESNVCYGGELGVPGTTPSNLVRHLQTPLNSRPNGVILAASVPCRKFSLQNLP